MEGWAVSKKKKVFGPLGPSSVQNKRGGGGGAGPGIPHCYEKAKVVTVFIFDLTL